MKLANTTVNIEYVVEKILNRKSEKGKNVYLVKWEGYNSDNNTWEPEENLTNCKERIKEFLKNFSTPTYVKPSKKKRDIPLLQSNSQKKPKLNTEKPVTQNNLPPIKECVSTGELIPNKFQNLTLNTQNKNLYYNDQNMKILRLNKPLISNKSLFKDDDHNWFELNLNPLEICGRTFRDGQFYYLVDFACLKDFQFVKDTFVEEAVPELVVEYFEKRRYIV